VGKAAVSIADVAQEHLASDPLDTEVVEQEIAGVRVSGELRSLRESGQLITTYSKSGAGRELEAWIRHLFLCVAEPGGCGLSTLLVTRGEYSRSKPGRTGFRAAGDARKILADLVELYLSGMERPLPFLPEVSKAFREQRAKGIDAPAALARAVRSRFDDPYVDVVFGDLRESLAAQIDSFAETAERVFAPLDAHLEGIE
jgi:exodeoxyribonuclease V gamma subunit